MERTAGLRGPIERLASLDRASCSPGEHEAAQWIAAALRERGATADVELERVHGSYWWPLGITSALGILAAAAARRGRRRTGALLGGVGAALVVDDLGAGRRWLRRLLPKQMTANVVARMGDSGAARTLLIVSHHDAAHSGFFFNPRITKSLARWRRRDSGTSRGAPAPMAPIVAGPALAGLGALAGRRAIAAIGGAVCAGIIASFVDIARRPTVPGANDNLTGVATVLAVASALKERPVRGLAVTLVSTGAEEALMEGMRAFARRYFPQLDPQGTAVVCVDSVGSPQLVLAEAEGMLRVRPYDPALKQLIAKCAEEAGATLVRGMTMRLGTDGYLALRHGLPAAMLMSVNEFGTASNYHWPTDIPDRVDYGTLRDAVTICERLARALADPDEPSRR